VPSLKAIRKRIQSVQSTQKITRAMKMVAGARLNRAQQRILEMRPYALKTHEVLYAVTEQVGAVEEQAESELAAYAEAPPHKLLEGRPEKRVLMLVLTSDRGLCGAFNANINKRAEREWKSRTADGQEVQMVLVGRKGRDYMSRRGAPILEYIPGIWDEIGKGRGLDAVQKVGEAILGPFQKAEVDALYIVYNEFKSAMSQQVVVERLLPVASPHLEGRESYIGGVTEFIYEPDKGALLERLVPMYVDISILRALYESQASELGARMTAMDAATKNAKEMIASLTLQYNKARQAAITKELMEIIGGSEALKD
jgi:F-type H+-transporting ATPase subunit gamma